MRRAVTWIGPRPGVKVDVTAKRTFLGATMDFITMDVSCTWITTRDRALEGAANITLISTLHEMHFTARRARARAPA